MHRNSSCNNNISRETLTAIVSHNINVQFNVA